MELNEKIMLRMKQFEDERRPYETGMWKDITRFGNPRRENILLSSASNLKGQRKGKDAYDGTPLGALNTWSDGMQGFLVSKSLTWFRSEMDEPVLNKIDEVREWLQEYDRRMYSAYRRSNYYSVQGEWFRDAGSIGTATLYTEEDIVNQASVLTVIHPREVFIAENRFGQVDTVFRKFFLTAKQAVEKFGREKVSDNLRKDASERPDKNHEFVHAVFPNDSTWPGMMQVNRKLFRSVYIETKSSGENGVGNIVRDSGYDFNPYVVWRFRKNSDEVYGYSPMADALIEVFQLNQFGKTMIQAAQLAVEGAFNIPSEMRGNVRITPKGYNYYDDPQRVITPINTNINYPIGKDQQDRLQESIEDKFRVKYFQMLTRADIGKQRRTIEEIMSMKSEQAVLMGPQIDRLVTEGLSKEFEIISEIEDRAGRFDDMPIPNTILEYEDYTGRVASLNINFTGPLAQNQKRIFKMQPIQDGINAIAPMTTLFPNVRDRINEDEMAEEILESTNFPQHLIRSDEEVAEIRRRRAEELQQQKMLEMAGAAADAAPKLSKAPEPGSPLEAITKE